MIVFYRSQELLISRDAFMPLFSPDRFDLADLHHIQAVVSYPVHRPRRPRWQLLAEHHGTTICLYSTTEERTFGQVKRALVRALEANTRARSRQPVARAH